MIVDTSNHTHYDDSQFYMKSHIIQQVRVNDNLHDEGRNEKLYNLHVQFFN